MQLEHCFIIAHQFLPLCEENRKIDFFASISAAYNLINFYTLGRKNCRLLHITSNNDLIIKKSRCNLSTVLLSHINFSPLCEERQKIDFFALISAAYNLINFYNLGRKYCL